MTEAPQRDIVLLKIKTDATPQLLAQLRGDDKKDGCAGTFHTIGEIVIPCLGDGMIVRRYEQTTYRCTPAEHKETIGVFRESVNKKLDAAEQTIFGDDMIETTICRPLAVDICPCRTTARLDEYQQGILRDLGVETLPKKLHGKQDAGFAEFKKKKSLLIWGPTGTGKSTLAAKCAMEYQRGVTVQKGDEIATELRNMAMNNAKPKYKGLLIHDDISRMTATEAMREKMFLIFDGARAKSFQYILTSQDSPEAICEKFSLGDKNARDAMLGRISALTEVKL